MHDLKWSEREKKIARRVFDQVVANELNGVMEKMKQRAAAARSPKDMWDLRRFLEREQRRIDETYEFRYSSLPTMFAGLVFEGKLQLDDLAELGEDKREIVDQGVDLIRAVNSTERRAKPDG